MLGWLEKFEYVYVGTVEGVTRHKREDGTTSGETRCYWTLSENGWGQRRSVRTGIQAGSPHSTRKAAEVKAWLAGGPLPDLSTVAEYASVEPPKKPELKVVRFKPAPEGD